MRKTRDEAAQTRSRIVAVASKLFLDRGITSVGTREIMQECGLTQGAFYRHFASKNQLIAEANLYAALKLLGVLRDELGRKAPSDAVRYIVDSYLRQADSSSEVPRCPLAILGAEIAFYGDEVRTVAKCGYEQYVELIAGLLSNVPKREAKQRASAGVSLMVGAVTLARSTNDPTVAGEILRNASVTALVVFGVDH